MQPVAVDAREQLLFSRKHEIPRDIARLPAPGQRRKAPFFDSGVHCPHLLLHRVTPVKAALLHVFHHKPKRVELSAVDELLHVAQIDRLLSDGNRIAPLRL